MKRIRPDTDIGSIGILVRLAGQGDGGEGVAVQEDGYAEFFDRRCDQGGQPFVVGPVELPNPPLALVIAGIVAKRAPSVVCV